MVISGLALHQSTESAAQYNRFLAGQKLVIGLRVFSRAVDFIQRFHIAFPTVFLLRTVQNLNPQPLRCEFACLSVCHMLTPSKIIDEVDNPVQLLFSFKEHEPILIRLTFVIRNPIHVELDYVTCYT